jgi:c-di-GMP-binding flagellar brake protein YcgR
MNEPIRSAPPHQTLKPHQDRRRHQRVKVNLLGRFMLENKQEFPCQVINMSPGGAALISPVRGRINERVVAYIDHIGRVEGRVVRPIEGGFVMTVEATVRKREKIAAQLTWLANRHVLNLPEDRRHERYSPKNPFTTISLSDGRSLRCRLVDVSLSGAAVAITGDAPEIGEQVLIARIRGRIVRRFDDGLAIEFAAVQTRDTLELNFG